MAASNEPTSQHFSNIHIGGESKVQLGHAYYRNDEFYATLDQLAPSKHNLQSHFDRDRLVEGSVDWYLQGEKYLQWRDGETDTLFSEGLPGAGKTVLMSCVADDIDYLIRKDVVNTALVTIFASFSTRTERSVTDALASIARQLVETKPSLLSILKDHLNPRSPFTRSRLLDLLLQLCNTFDRVYIVLDALDELALRLEDRLDMIAALCSIRERLSGTTSFKVCISSRHEQQTKDAIGPCTTEDVRASAQSIRAFIVDILKRSPTLKRLPESSELYQEVVRTVEQRSDRLFKLADLQMQYLANLTSALKIKKALPKLSDRFDFYYDQSLTRIEGKVELKAPIFNLMTWLVYSKSPLHTDELRQCLAVGDDLDPETRLDELDEDVDRLVAESEGLIRILDREKYPASTVSSRSHRLVELVHETIHAFLARTSGRWLDPETSSEWHVSLACARFISLTECFDALIKNALKMQCKLCCPFLDGLPPFLQWSVGHWEINCAKNSEMHAKYRVATSTLRQTVSRLGSSSGFDVKAIWNLYLLPKEGIFDESNDFRVLDHISKVRMGGQSFDESNDFRLLDHISKVRMGGQRNACNAELQTVLLTRIALCLAEAEKKLAEAEKERAEAEKERAEAEKERAEAEKERAEAQKEAQKERAEAQKKMGECLLRIWAKVAEIARHLTAYETLLSGRNALLRRQIVLLGARIDLCRAAFATKWKFSYRDAFKVRPKTPRRTILQRSATIHARTKSLYTRTIGLEMVTKVLKRTVTTLERGSPYLSSPIEEDIKSLIRGREQLIRELQSQTRYRKERRTEVGQLKMEYQQLRKLVSASRLRVRMSPEASWVTLRRPKHFRTQRSPD